MAPATTAGTAPTTTAPTTTAPTTTAPTTTAATTTAPITTVPSTSTTAVAVTEADWKALAGGLSGRLSRPGSPGYPVDLELYDPRFDGTHPAAIAFCASSSDVARSITFAREHGLALAARSGGHSYGGYSTSRGLVVDVSRMSISHGDGRRGHHRCRGRAHRRLLGPGAGGGLHPRRLVPDGGHRRSRLGRRHRGHGPPPRCHVRQRRRADAGHGGGRRRPAPMPPRTPTSTGRAAAGEGGISAW